MRKVVLILLAFTFIQACDGGGPGSRVDEQMAAPKLTVAEYDSVTGCVNLQWEPVYTASKYKVTRLCEGTCYGVAFRVEKETTNLSFQNCYYDQGDWAFDRTSGYSFNYLIEARVEGAGGVGTTWGGTANYRTPHLW